LILLERTEPSSQVLTPTETLVLLNESIHGANGRLALVVVHATAAAVTNGLRIAA
jgi:hypothetical protein